MCPSVGTNWAPSTRDASINGKRSRDSSADTVDRQAERLRPSGWRASASIRYGEDARCSVPTWCHPGSTPVPPRASGRAPRRTSSSACGSRSSGAGHEPGRVERRAARELTPIQEHHVGPAQTRQVVGDARPRHAAADTTTRARSSATARSLARSRASRRSEGRPSSWRVGRSASSRTQRSRCRAWTGPAARRPHRLAEVGHDPHQLQASAARIGGFLEVEGQQPLLRVVGERVVDREVPRSKNGSPIPAYSWSTTHT